MNQLGKILLYLMVLSSAHFAGQFCYAADGREWSESIKLNFGLDDREWDMGWSNKSELVYIMEFVPKGQNVENWKELITFEFYPGLQKHTNCSQFADGFIKYLKETEPNARITNYLNKSNNVIIEWVLNGSAKNADQDELDRFILGEEGLHAVHYVKKTKTLTEQERAKWLKFLESATLLKEK